MGKTSGHTEPVNRPGDSASGANAYQFTLMGLVFPLAGHLIFDAIAAGTVLLMGHAAMAAVVFVTAGLVDTLHVRLLRRWIADSADTPVDAGFRKLALLSALRVSVYVLPIFILAVRGGLAELGLFGIQACMLVALALSAGSFSQRIFWGFCTPVTVAATAYMLLRFPPQTAAALLMSLGSLLLLLWMISHNTRKAITAWHAAFQANLALVDELKTARDNALAERASADAAREEARRANRAKSNFLATMSHEIRTPMNGVLGMAQLLKRDEAEPKQIARLDTLIDSGEYLLSILNDILDVSKIDAGRLEITPRPEELRPFLDRTVEFWSGRADEKGVALRLEVDALVPDVVLMDGLRVRQVLFNLIGNALKFTETGGVEVVARSEPDGPGGVRLLFAVRDTGPGIAAHRLPTLFDRFSQGDDSEIRKFGGTGLGLAIVKQLSELMGGRVWAESEVGAGSSFYVELPLRLASGAEPAPSVADPQPAEARPIAGLKLLAVDDNAVNLLVLDQLLASFGAEVVKAASGPEALDMLAAQAFDLVLMDIQMPGMSGVEALQRLREAQGPNREVPVIALTADVTSGGRERYLELGFTEHSAKPIQIGELMAAIARALAAEPPAASKVA